MQSTIREELGEFSPEEYVFALPQYLSHYGIDCELLADANATCHHPLILRFFCEAYGSPGGPPVKLGAVVDIRLRELFDLYFTRKADEIRGALGLRSTADVEIFLFRFVGKMYQKAASVLLLSEIGDATGEEDFSSEDSLYVRLLDEDIILEEQPADALSDRRVTFVYEEFMEFLLARAILAVPTTFGIDSYEAIFDALEARKREWVNARGIGEYVVQMLLTSPSEQRSAGLALLERMAKGDHTWRSAFWAVIPKLHDAVLDVEIYDVIAVALERQVQVVNIRKCLNAISKSNRDLADKLGGVILWSLAVPRVVSWRQALSLSTLSASQAANLARELEDRLSRRDWKPAPQRQLHSGTHLLEVIAPLFSRRVKRSLKERLQMGGPLIRIIWEAFPEYQLLAVNGLYETTPGIRDVSAWGLRYVTTARPQLALIVESLAAVEEDGEIAALLTVAAQALSSSRRRARHQ